MSAALTPFASLIDIATYFRTTLESKKYILLYAYNGTGKTRLSMAFKDAGKMRTARPFNANDAVDKPLTIEELQIDTLYFNAFTEDLFSWDNDLDADTQRVLRINKDSRFFNGLQELEMESRIRLLLQRYADYDFLIDYEAWTVNFIREIKEGDTTKPLPHIKVSRGEENIFIWCFFLAVAQLAIDEQEAYKWVKFIYIDDPISSLDDNNAIAVASHLAQMLKKETNKVKTVVSSHHALFFNVMCNELGNAEKYFLSKESETSSYILRDTRDTPRFHHVGMLKELKRATDTDNLYTYHFNILRSLLEKTATFHGFNDFSDCIKQDENDEDGILHKRIINVMSHGNYSLFEPMQMLDENKNYFKKILRDFMENYRFNPELFPEEATVS
jgi:wobble nucleotide-excising tRNase